MAENINKSFVYNILKKGLLNQHNIEVKDADLLKILNAGAAGDKGALSYLENSTEIQQLLEALQGVNDTYTVENLDTIIAYLKENPEYNDDFFITFDDFYVETFSDMFLHLTHKLLDLQNIDQIFHFTKMISKRRSELNKIDFPDDYNELTFVVQTIFDAEDGAFVHQVFMGKTQEVSEEQVNDMLSEMDDDDDSTDGESDFYSKEKPFNIDQFICIWSKRTRNKNMILVTLRLLSYGDDLFTMFELDEEQVKKKKK